jgi:hypothetical protein
MGMEIIRHMEIILRRPGEALLCAQYSEGPGAVQAFYVSHGTESISWYWYKLREEIKNPLSDISRIVAVHESKLPLDEFLKFLTDEKAPGFRMSAQFEQAVMKVMTPELALDFVRAGVNLERAGRGLPAIDFPGIK